MKDGMTSVNPDDLFAVLDLSDQVDVNAELWNHPGTNAMMACRHPGRFGGKLIERLPPRNLERDHPGNDAREVYAPPSEPNPFPEVAMGGLRKEFIGFMKRPIEFERRIDEDYQVLISHTL